MQRAVEAILAEHAGDPAYPASVTFAEGSQGADPTLVAIIVTVVGHAATRFFDDVIWPRLREYLADDALGPREPDSDASPSCGSGEADAQ